MTNVKDEVKHYPFTCTRMSNGDVGFKIGDKTLSPQEISAKILGKLKTAAENYLGHKVTEAVLLYLPISTMLSVGHP